MRSLRYIFVLITVTAAGFVTGCSGAKELEVKEEYNEQIIVEGNNKFALELYDKLQSTGGNLFFSPYSISTALAMVYTGARGQTESQIAGVLHFPIMPIIGEPSSSVMVPDRKQFAALFGTIIKDINHRGQKGGYELSTANALWGQKGYQFLQEYLKLIEAHYDGKLTEVDFKNATETARRTINEWVEEKTNQKIKELIKSGVLDAMTRLVLTNAIYFKGNWASQFNKDRTREAPFTLPGGDKTNVSMMNKTEEFSHLATENFQVLELPYVDNGLSMIIFLPNKPDGLGEFEKSLTAENLSLWLGQLQKRKVIVSIPKFKMTSEFSLASTLKSMGMTDAFTAKADLSGINGKRDLFISAVIHKAYVDVNEEGTEAAAATAVAIKLLSAGPDQTPVFRADHPFVFMIRDNNSGGILFMGRVMNPNA